MKCMGCGRQIADEVRFCPHCGYNIPGPDGVPQQHPVQKAGKEGMSAALIAVLVIAIVVIVVVAVIGVLWLSSTTHGEPDLRENLTLYYVEGWDYWDNGYVSIEGVVYNYGDAGCYATLHCTISDDRGWSISPTIELGWIGPNGDSISVEQEYNWPDNYNDMYADGDSLYWTCYFTHTM